MKLSLLLLVVPLVLAVPEKRFLLDSLRLETLLDIPQITHFVSALAHQYGDDPTEQECEAKCHSLVLGETSLIHWWCEPVCRSAQTLIQMLDHETSAPTGHAHAHAHTTEPSA